MQNQLTNNNLNYKNKKKEQPTIKGEKSLLLNAVVFIEPKFL